MGATCCKANKTNEKAYVDRSAEIEDPIPNAPENAKIWDEIRDHVVTVKDTPVTGVKDGLELVHYGDFVNPSHNPSSTIDARLPFHPAVQGPQNVIEEPQGNELNNYSMNSIPDEDVDNIPVMHIPRLTFKSHATLHNSTKALPAIRTEPSEQPKPQLSSPVYKMSPPTNNSDNDFEDPFARRKESEEGDLVMPMYIAPRQSDSTQLKKTDSQATQNLNFILEQSNHRNRETGLKVARTAWLQINYIPEQVQYAAPINVRPAVAKFGTTSDLEMRRDLFKTESEYKNRERDYGYDTRKKALEITVPSRDIVEYMSAADKLSNLIEKFRKETVIVLSIGRGEVVYDRRNIASINRPTDVYASGTVEKIREVLSL